MRFLACLALLLLLPFSAQAYKFDLTPDACVNAQFVENHNMGRWCDRDGVLHPIKRMCSPAPTNVLTSTFVLALEAPPVGNDNGAGYTYPDPRGADYGYAMITCWNDTPNDPVCADDEFLYSYRDGDDVKVMCKKFENKFCKPGFVETFSPPYNYSCERPDKIDPATYCTSADLAPYTFETINKEFKRACLKYSE